MWNSKTTYKVILALATAIVLLTFGVLDIREELSQVPYGPSDKLSFHQQTPLPEETLQGEIPQPYSFVGKDSPDLPVPYAHDINIATKTTQSMEKDNNDLITEEGHISPAAVSTCKDNSSLPRKAGQQDILCHSQNDTLIPRHVHYIWCGTDRRFGFHNYLSVKAIIYLLRPDPLLFHYQERPAEDSKHYNTWFEELKEEYVFFQQIEMNATEVQHACKGSYQDRVVFISRVLNHTGGIYVHENTILVGLTPALLRRNFVMGITGTDEDGGFLMTKPGVLGEKQVLALLSKNTEAGKASTICPTVSASLSKEINMIPCVQVKSLYPKDIWEASDTFAKFARQVMYGTPEEISPIKSSTSLTPNIVHMVWMGGNMSFLFYLGVLSALYVSQVDRVFIYGPSPPTGKYWQRIANNTKVHFVYRYRSNTIFGKQIVGKMAVKDVSDIWRLEILMMYGGVYMDTDALLMKPLDNDIRSYDAVANYDWINWFLPFPDVVNNGVMMGKPNAKFWHLLEQNMKLYDPSQVLWSNIRIAYKVKERHPETLKIEPHLQVICYQARCHPTWWKGYHSAEQNHLNPDKNFNWKNDTYAFHWTAEPPVELQNETQLFRSNTMVSDMGKYILGKAGVLDGLQKKYSSH